MQITGTEDANARYTAKNTSLTIIKTKAMKEFAFAHKTFKIHKIENGLEICKM